MRTGRAIWKDENFGENWYSNVSHKNINRICLQNDDIAADLYNLKTLRQLISVMIYIISIVWRGLLKYSRNSMISEHRSIYKDIRHSTSVVSCGTRTGCLAIVPSTISITYIFIFRLLYILYSNRFRVILWTMDVGFVCQINSRNVCKILFYAYHDSHTRQRECSLFKIWKWKAIDEYFFS